MLLYGLGGRPCSTGSAAAPAATSSSARSAWSCSLTGVVMATNLDVRFEEALARDTSLPAIFVDPTRGLENSSAVQNRLASLRPAVALRHPPAARGGRGPDRRAGAGVAIPGVRTPAAAPPRPRAGLHPTPSGGSTPPAAAR